MAAGKSERLGFDKLFYKLNKKPLLWHTVNAFEKAACIDDIVLVCNEQNLSSVSALCAGFKKISAITLGGAERMHSVLNGLEKAQGDIVAVHDGARPFISKSIIEQTAALAVKYGAAAPFTAVKDTIKLKNGPHFETLERSNLFAAQTPQVFKKTLLGDAINAFSGTATDDCAVVEAAGHTVAQVQGDYFNIKITTQEDIIFANAIAKVFL